MARPLKDGMDYFPHDVDASHDEKIEALEALFGIAGYAVYFKMLERIYRAGGELRIPDAEMVRILSRNITETPQEFSEILQFACKYGLFDECAWKERSVLTSNGIKKRVESVEKKREKSRVSGSCKVPASETPQKRGKVKESIYNTYDAQFDEFWDAYPRNRDKMRTFKTWCARKNEGVDPQQMIEAAKLYAKECQREGKEERYIKHGTTFLAKEGPFTEYKPTPKVDKPRIETEAERLIREKRMMLHAVQ